jgi:hypothetical protein
MFKHLTNERFRGSVSFRGIAINNFHDTFDRGSPGISDNENLGIIVKNKRTNFAERGDGSGEVEINHCDCS